MYSARSALVGFSLRATRREEKSVGKIKRLHLFLLSSGAKERVEVLLCCPWCVRMMIAWRTQNCHELAGGSNNLGKQLAVEGSAGENMRNLFPS